MSRPGVRVQVDGDTRLSRTLRGAGRDLENLTGAHAEAARIVAAGVRSRAPRRTGYLASTVRPVTDVDAAVVAVGAVYAPVIANGWPAHNIKPNPFASNGVESTEPAWLDAYRDAVEDALRKVKGA